MTETKREFTFKHNQNLGRHGWLRLTPAYSVKIVQDILNTLPSTSRILDPFSGTGTTGLVAAEHGFTCDLVDINPFLVWLARAKTTNYRSEDLDLAALTAKAVPHMLYSKQEDDHLWIPAIHDISRWWSERELYVLARIYQAIQHRFLVETQSKNLLLVAFCRLVIEASNAAFNHQSMSFKDEEKQQSLWAYDWQADLLRRFDELVHDAVQSARHYLPGHVNVICADSRHLPKPSDALYDCVITSPPYPNRMSYIRELRPYMYWLGYLKEAREAAELDWKAIGGTWGVATSRLKNWQPNGVKVLYSDFDALISEIAQNSSLLANYVHKYFVDSLIHLQNLLPVLSPSARVFYVVGNSKFYNTLVPVDQIYAHLLADVGFIDVRIDTLRKRNSKKELFEYVVSARKPG